VRLTTVDDSARETLELTGKARWLAFMPRHCWRLRRADAHARYTGPCGDTMEIWLKLRRGRVVKATFDTDGCDATFAAGSAVTTLAKGLTVEEAYRVDQAAVLDFLGGLPEAYQHCALLAATTLHRALDAARERMAQQRP
jgi:nitrogen fixation NifU-like protein